MRRIIRAFAALIAMCVPAGAQSEFDLAEQRLADCAARADLHPPYVKSVWQVCENEVEAYVRACLPRTLSKRAEFDCRGGAITLAESTRKRDPVDVKFVDCMRRAGPRSPTELLTLCRFERRAFEASCQRRKDAKQCEDDVGSIARSVCSWNGGGYECE